MHQEQSRGMMSLAGRTKVPEAAPSEDTRYRPKVGLQKARARSFPFAAALREDSVPERSALLISEHSARTWHRYRLAAAPPGRTRVITRARWRSTKRPRELNWKHLRLLSPRWNRLGPPSGRSQARPAARSAGTGSCRAGCWSAWATPSSLSTAPGALLFLTAERSRCGGR